MAERWVALTASIPGLDLAVPNRFIALNSAGSIFASKSRWLLFCFCATFLLVSDLVIAIFLFVPAFTRPVSADKGKTKITEASHSTAR